MAISRRRDLLASAVLVGGLVLGFAADSSRMTRGVFVTTAFAALAVAYGRRPTTPRERWETSIFWAAVVIGIALTFLLSPGWLGVVVIWPVALAGAVVGALVGRRVASTGA